MGSAKTSFRFSHDPLSEIEADGLIIPVFQSPEAARKSEEKPEGKTDLPAAKAVVWPISPDPTLRSLLETVMEEEKFNAAKGKLLVFRPSPGEKPRVRRIILLGMGEASKSRLSHWESGLQKAMSVLLGLKDANAAAIVLPGKDGPELPFGPDALIAIAVDAVDQATYRSSEAKDPPPELKTATLLISKTISETISDASDSPEAILRRAGALSGARSFVKDLVNRPANLKTTRTLRDEASRLGEDPVIEAHIENDVAWIEREMPCFYTVARGSLATDPPCFITLRYQPSQAKKHIAVIGKSVIFDTGGYQVKPGDYMVTMKGDMTGGAVALGVMRALAALKPEHIQVSAYLAVTPNKIDSDAMLPDSIVGTTCGKRVEIRHTDAEGRLTLIDAVAKAADNKPEEIITIATLTGSASQAVGCSIALMGNNEALRDRIAQAGRSHGEPIQTLDVIEDDYENIKSKLDGADLINTSQRKNRGAQTAAAFVMSGAPDGIAMAHLDIAGADMTPDEKATGISVKTILQYLLDEDQRLSGH